MQLCTEMAYRATRAGGSKAYRSSVLYSHTTVATEFLNRIRFCQRTRCSESLHA